MMQKTIPHSPGHDRISEIRRKMTPVANLAYGTTPWDKLETEDLIFLLHSYHRVVEAALCALEINTTPGFRSGICEESIVQCRAARDYMFSDYIGPTVDRFMSGAADVEGSNFGNSENEVFYRATMRGVSGCLGFDVPDTVWWACKNCDICLGKAPGQPAPTTSHAVTCGKDSKNCDFYRYDWESFRVEGAKVA